MAFDEGVVEGDFLKFTKAGEVGVRFGGAFRAVDDEKADEREVALLGHLFDGSLELAIFHGGEFIEERKNEAGCEKGEKKGEGGDGEPSIDPGIGEGCEEPKNEGDEGNAEEGTENEAFELVCGEDGGGGLVEAVLFLMDEGVMDVEEGRGGWWRGRGMRCSKFRSKSRQRQRSEPTHRASQSHR